MRAKVTTGAAFKAERASRSPPPLEQEEEASSKAAMAFSPELKFVSACLSWPHDQRSCERIQKAATEPLDWSRVLQLAGRHRVAGLVQHGVMKAGLSPPPSEAERLRSAERQTAFEELRMTSEVTRLHSAFCARGVKAVVLKGIAAALQGYGCIGLRQNRDIDFLIDPAHVLEAILVLEREGYVPAEPPETLRGADLAEWMRTHKDLVFRHLEHGIIVEVHWRLFDNRRFAPSLSSLAPVELRLPHGSTFLALPMEVAFLYMGAHGAQHAWSRLKWLADFAAYAHVLGSSRVEDLYISAKSVGLGGCLGQGLLLANELMGTLLPQTVTADLSASWRLQLLHRVGRRALGAEEIVELEDRAFGSTLKTLSHYLLNGHLGYLLAQALLDVAEVPKSYASPLARRLGPFAKGPLWIYLRLAHALRRIVHRN